MCLGVPGKVVRWIERTEPFARAEVEFGGVRREVGMDCVADAAEGDYVIVHAGVAIARIDADEARRTLAFLAAMGEAEGGES
jgi:hydrogenase expression/formation protein HypC